MRETTNESTLYEGGVGAEPTPRRSESGAPSRAPGDEAANRLSDWQLAHAHLQRVARRRAGLDLEEGRWLLAAFRAGTHVRLGYGSFAEYIERLLGYAPRLAHEKLRVAEALETLNALPLALRDARLSWSAVRELTRVVTPETEKEWVSAAEGRTVRDVERLVAGHRPGSRPQDPAEPDQLRRVLRFDVSGETFAAFREAVAQIRRDAGTHMNDDDVLMLMARHVLGGPSDTGRASYQMALTVCEDCQRARQHAQGELLDVSAEVLAMAKCDAQHLTEAAAHVGSSADPKPRVARATQDTPPAVRRLVLRRDEGRCVVPGCRHCTFLDLHHLVQRADGGGHRPDNLITLCGAHHRAVHLGALVISGSVTAGLRFLHANGTAYGTPGLEPPLADLPSSFVAEDEADQPNRAQSLDEGVSSEESGGRVEETDRPATDRPQRVDPVRLRSLTLRALHRLGFGQRESQQAIEIALTHVGSSPTIEQLLRLALRALTGELAHAS